MVRTAIPNDDFIKAVSEIIRGVAETVIRPHFLNLDPAATRYKGGPLDPATIADDEGEAALTQALSAFLPGSQCLGEEATAGDRTLLTLLQDDSGAIWVIDPLDGTNNFTEGVPRFGTMVALVERGKILAGWLYNIMDQSMLCVVSGKGIYLNDNLVSLIPRPHNPVIGHIGWKLYQFPEVKNIQVEEGWLRLHPTFDPAVITYAQFAKGELDFLVFRIINPWDHLPGLALAAEQNAVIRKWDGNPFDINNLPGGLVVARTQEIWTKVRQAIIEPLSRSAELLALT